MFREDEKILVLKNGEQIEMGVSDIAFAFNDYLRKTIESKRNPNVNFSKDFFNVGLKVKGVSGVDGKEFFDVVKAITVSRNTRGVNVCYKSLVDGKRVKTLIPMEQKVLDINLLPIIPKEGDVLFGGIKVESVAVQGNFNFINIETAMLRNIEKNGLILIK